MPVLVSAALLGHQHMYIGQNVLLCSRKIVIIPCMML